MADQEFLASFGVEIDEGGVSRLQAILEQNRQLAAQVSEQFAAAAKAVKEYQKTVSGGDNPSGEGTRDDGSGSGAGSARSGTGNTGSGAAGKGAAETDTAGQGSSGSVKDDVEARLRGSLFGEEGSVKGWYLSNLEEYTRATVTRNASRLKETLTSWDQYGLNSDPAQSGRADDYATLQKQAYETLRDPISQVRQLMADALSAEEGGEDTSGYVDQIVETLREPLKQIQQMYDDFDFGDADAGDADVGDSDFRRDGDAVETAVELDTSDAENDIEALKEAAEEPVDLQLSSSEAIAEARTAYSQIKAILQTPIQIKTTYGTGGSGNGSGGGTGAGANQNQKMSAGGRFTKATDVQVAEDGDPEYIIPVKKTNRAVPLLKQLLSELSPEARENLGLSGGMGLLSGGITASGAGTTAAITQNNENVSAPVTINVHASGANAEQIGQKLYDTTERYLLRTLKGAFS